MGNFLTHQQYKKRITNWGGKLCSEYIDMHTSIKLECEHCKKIYTRIPSNTKEKQARFCQKCIFDIKSKVQIGNKFGRLTVIERIDKINSQGTKIKYWICKCDCGNITECQAHTLTSGHSSSCGCKRLESITSAYKDITGTWYGNIKRHAEKRGFIFNVTKKQLQDLLEQQEYKCNLSKLPIYISKYRSGKKYYEETTASLDRIDNDNIEYIVGNIQFLHKHINYMKWTHNQTYFIELCKLIAKNN